jgi:phosphatidylglycerophosphate synthase
MLTPASGGSVRRLPTGPVIGLIAQIALLATLAETVRLGAAGWAVGVTYGLVTNVALARGVSRFRAERLGPANAVTLTRATLVGGVAALVADSLARPAPVPTLVVLSIVALVLDAVDGWVARRTGTASRLGLRFDEEVDSFLILVLSVYVTFSSVWWVLAIGLARYVFAGAGWVLPWMRATLPPRYWGKVVAAVQGITLTVATADVLPRAWMSVALVASAALLGESFGRSVWWLHRHRHWTADQVSAAVDHWAGAVDAPERRRARGWARTAAAAVTTTLALLLVWVALIAPNQLDQLTFSAFVRIPLEALVIVALVLLLPRGVSRVVAVLAGALLGLLTVVKLLDVAFFEVLDRPFDPVGDWSYFGGALETLRASFGSTGAVLALIGVGSLAVAVPVLTVLSALRLTRIAVRHRAWSLRAATALGVVWVLCAVPGAQLVSDTPIASTSAASLAYSEVRAVRAGVQDHATFADDIVKDRFRHTAGDQLLTGLRGKDVIVAIVESYGRVAVQGTDFSVQVRATLDAGTRRLQAAGFSSRSAWLTSPTFGGISWLAHSTLQSGVWVNSQSRYDQLVASDRFTLSRAFKRAGWRTVDDVPSNNRTWTQGTTFYHYDKIYDRRDVGYEGPTFAYASMPDQYVLSAFHRLELAKRDRRPVFAELDLVSSHEPWTRIPRLIDWAHVGDGSVFAGMPVDQVSKKALYGDPSRVRAAYGRSIQYTLNSLVSFVQHYGDDDLVLVVLGDHQPWTVVSGHGGNRNHDVPISVIAHDPTVLDRISGWGWQPGLRPDPQAPLWRMDSFRDRFLTAYGPKHAAP